MRAHAVLGIVSLSGLAAGLGASGDAIDTSQHPKTFGGLFQRWRAQHADQDLPLLLTPLLDAERRRVLRSARLPRDPFFFRMSNAGSGELLGESAFREELTPARGQSDQHSLLRSLPASQTAFAPYFRRQAELDPDAKAVAICSLSGSPLVLPMPQPRTAAPAQAQDGLAVSASGGLEAGGAESEEEVHPNLQVTLSLDRDGSVLREMFAKVAEMAESMLLPRAGTGGAASSDLWINTEGTAVPWTHLRLDTVPKFYPASSSLVGHENFHQTPTAVCEPGHIWDRGRWIL